MAVAVTKGRDPSVMVGPLATALYGAARACPEFVKAMSAGKTARLEAGAEKDALLALGAPADEVGGQCMTTALGGKTVEMDKPDAMDLVIEDSASARRTRRRTPDMTTRSHARGSLAGGLALAVALARSVASADEPPATPTPSPPTAPAAAPPAPATVSTLGAPSPPPLAAPAPGQPPASPPGATPPTGGHWVFVADPTPPRPAETAKPGPVPVYHGPIYTKANTWDANLEGAFGRYFGDEAKWTGFVRARAGLLIVREPLYTAVGLTYEYSNLSNATFGVQADSSTSTPARGDSSEGSSTSRATPASWPQSGGASSAWRRRSGRTTPSAAASPSTRRSASPSASWPTP